MSARAEKDLGDLGDLGYLNTLKVQTDARSLTAVPVERAVGKHLW